MFRFIGRSLRSDILHNNLVGSSSVLSSSSLSALSSSTASSITTSSSFFLARFASNASNASTSDTDKKSANDPSSLGAVNKKELLQQYRRAAKLAEKVKAVSSNPLSDQNKVLGKHPLQRRVTVVMTNGATTTLNLVSESKFLRLEEDYVSLFESSKLRPLGQL